MKRTTRRRAFTLLELVIVIGIILILMGLALAVSSSVLASNDRRTMENTFKMLDQALDSWQSQMGRELSFGRRVVPGGGTSVPDFTLGTNGPSASYDIYEENFATSYAICVVLEKLSASPDAMDVLSRIPGTSLRSVPVNGLTIVGEPVPANWAMATAQTDPNQMPSVTAANPNALREIIDPWGRRISVAFAGRRATKAELSSTATSSPPIDVEDGSVRTGDEQLLGVCRNRRMYFISSGPDGEIGDTANGTSADNIYSYQPKPKP